MKLIKFLFFLIFLAVAGVIVLIFNLNSIIKTGVETGGEYLLQVPVTLEKSDISFMGKGELKGLNIGNPEGFKSKHLFDLSSAKVEIDLFSVTSEVIHIKEISIVSPYMIYEGSAKNSNVKTLLDNLSGDAQPETAPEDPESEQPKEEEQKTEKKIIIDHLLIKDTKVGYSNALLGGRTINLTLPTIEQHDIGKKDGGQPIQEVIKEILSDINKSILKGVQDAGQNIGNQIEDLGKNLNNDKTKETLNKAKDKLKGLFGK